MIQSKPQNVEALAAEHPMGKEFCYLFYLILKKCDNIRLVSYFIQESSDLCQQLRLKFLAFILGTVLKSFKITSLTKAQS